MEKCIETLEEAIIHSVGESNASSCPAVRIVHDLLSLIKASNNREIAVQLGIALGCGVECPCRRDE